MSVPIFSTGQLATAANLNAIVNQVNANTNYIDALFGGSAPYIIRAGTVSIALSSQASANAAVGFGYTFSSAPIVLVSLSGAAGGTARLVPRSYGTGVASTTLAVYTGDGSTTTGTAQLTWLAIGAQ